MRALVTGCAGFIGSHVTESLLADGHEVVGVDCFNDNYPRADKLANLERALDHDAFEFVQVDLAVADPAKLVTESDAVFHLAAEPGVRTSWGSRFEQFVRNNVLVTQRLLEATTALPERRFVYASSSSIYGDAEQLPTTEDATPSPFSPYGMTKLAAEHLCQVYHANHGVETVALRFFTVYGPRQRPDMAFNRFCRAALGREPIRIFGDGRQTRDFTFVHDIARAVRAAAVAPDAAGRVYNLGGGSRVSVNHVLELLATIAGRPLDVRYLESERGDVRNTGADTTRARRELGFKPSCALAEGLAAEFEWMRSTLERRDLEPSAVAAAG